MVFLFKKIYFVEFIKNVLQFFNVLYFISFVLRGYKVKSLNQILKRNRYNSDIQIYNVLDITKTVYTLPNNHSFYLIKKSIFNEKVETAPQVQVTIFKNASVFSDGGFIFYKNFIPTDYSIIEPFPFLFDKIEGKPEYKNGSIAVIASDPSYTNYYHWMIESFPRLHLIRESGIEPDFYYVHYNTSFQKSALESAGISNHKIIPAKNNSYITAEELIVPSILNNKEEIWIKGERFYQPKYIPLWVTKFLRDSFLPPLNDKNEISRIYISRKKANSRMIINEEEVFNFLKPLGFYFFCMEDLTFQEQVNLFSNANVIVANHGAALTNLVFCKPKAIVIEIFHPDYCLNFYWLLSNNVNLVYNYLIAEGNHTKFNNKKKIKNYDVIVNISDLERILSFNDIN